MINSNSSTYGLQIPRNISDFISVIFRNWKGITSIIVVLCSSEWALINYVYDLKHTSEIYMYQITIDNLNRDVNNLNKEVDNLKKNEEKLKIEIDRAEQKLIHKDNEISILNHKLLEKSDEMHELRNQLNYYRIKSMQ